MFTFRILAGVYLEKTLQITHFIDNQLRSPDALDSDLLGRCPHIVNSIGCMMLMFA